MSMVPILATLPFLSPPSPMVSWSSLGPDDRGKKDSGPVYRSFCMICWHHPKCTAATLQSLSGISQKLAMKGNTPSGHKFKQFTLLFTLLRRRNGQKYHYILIHWLWPMVWLDGQGFGRNMIRKQVAGKFGEEVWE